MLWCAVVCGVVCCGVCGVFVVCCGVLWCVVCALWCVVWCAVVCVCRVQCRCPVLCRRLACLKYLVLANMLMKSGINPFDSTETKAYKGNPEVLAMTNLVRSVGVGGDWYVGRVCQVRG